MTNDKDTLLIEDYLDGLLDEKKLAAVKLRLINDPEFNKEYEQRKRLGKLWVEADEYKKTRQQVKKILRAKQNPPKLFTANNYYMFAIAASIILLFGIYWFFVRPTGNKDINSAHPMATNNDTVLFKKDQPAQYGKIAYFNLLVKPANNEILTPNDTLVFRWKKSNNKRTIRFVLLNATDSAVVFQKYLTGKDTLLIIELGKLKTGTYYWYVNDSLKYRTFKIARTK